MTRGLVESVGNSSGANCRPKFLSYQFLVFSQCVRVWGFGVHSPKLTDPKLSGGGLDYKQTKTDPGGGLGQWKQWSASNPAPSTTTSPHGLQTIVKNYNCTKY